MISRLVDVHTHVQFHAFRDDADAVIKRALDAGIWIVNVGTQRDTSAGAVDLAQKYPEGVYATVGLHPIHTEKSYHDVKELGDGDAAKAFTGRGEDFDYEYYKNLAGDKKVVAIGECGLDYYRLDENTKDKQSEIFEKQIALSFEIKKPLMIHCRQAFKNLIDMLNAERSLLNALPGIIHFFSGSIADASKLLDLGFSFSFGGVITFARDYDDVLKFIPHERILLETDAPYVAPVPYRGKRNEPVYVAETARKLAELKDIPPEDISRITTQNAKMIFSLK